LLLAFGAARRTATGNLPARQLLSGDVERTASLHFCYAFQHITQRNSSVSLGSGARGLKGRRAEEMRRQRERGTDRDDELGSQACRGDARLRKQEASLVDRRAAGFSRAAARGV
jgi:hypothetical protein